MKKIIALIITILSIFIFNNSIYAYNEYKIGDEVKYNNIEFYVIKDSGSDDDIVTLLKKEPLTVEEVSKYGMGHINRYLPYNSGTVSNYGGYGAVAYYTSEDCGYFNDELVVTNCVNDYNVSDIKYIVDAWAKNVIKKDYKQIRLGMISDLSNLGYELFDNGSLIEWRSTEDTPEWMYSENYAYWFQSEFNDSNSSVYKLARNGVAVSCAVYSDFDNVIRPVVEIYKCAFDSSCKNDGEEYFDETIENNTSKNNDVDKKYTSDNVKVSNTLKRLSDLIVLIGLVLSCVGLNIFIIYKNKYNNKK